MQKIVECVISSFRFPATTGLRKDVPVVSSSRKPWLYAHTLLTALVLKRHDVAFVAVKTKGDPKVCRHRKMQYSQRLAVA